MPRRRKKKLDFSSIIGQSSIRNNEEDWLGRYGRMTANANNSITSGVTISNSTAAVSYATATTVSYAPVTYVLTNYNTDGTFTYTWR